MILSHFHDDHTSGLMTLRKDLAAAHPSAFSRVHVAKGMFDERRGSMTNAVLGYRKALATGAD